MKASEIAEKTNGTLSGDPELEILGLTSLEKAQINSIAFFNGDSTQADLSGLHPESCVLVRADFDQPLPCTSILVSDPKFAFALIASELKPSNRREGLAADLVIGERSVNHAQFVGHNVTIGRDSIVGSGVMLHDGVSIGDNVKIENRSVLHANVVIYDNVSIGADCILHAGAVIGAEGFGYVRNSNEILKFPQIGETILEDRVEIGANTCIDRGALGETRIGCDSKIDNLVQIAHNVTIGRRVLIAAHVGISGSVVIEDDVVIGGQVGIADHVTIKSGAVLGARSAVFPGKIVRAGVWAGSPVQPLDKYKEQNALVRSLARLKKDILKIKKQFE